LPYTSLPLIRQLVSKTSEGTVLEDVNRTRCLSEDRRHTRDIQTGEHTEQENLCLSPWQRREPRDGRFGLAPRGQVSLWILA
jgi:hypothetical protein